MVESAVRLGDWLRGASRRLGTRGCGEPTREARLIWAAVSGREPSEYQPAEMLVEPAILSQLDGLLMRRLSGEPLAHVTGLAGFRRLTLKSDGRALIPRPETEGLVELMLARVTQGRVADLGTGSGCIALSLADEGQFDRVVGVDCSRDALALAGENRTRTGLEVDLVHGEWFAPLAGERFEALISNPPYLTAAELDELDPSVRNYEPPGALASGVDGLEATRLLLTGGQSLLRPGGWIGLELDCRRAEASASIAVSAGWNRVTLHQDLFGRDRYLLAQRSDGQ
ncbi:MAG TPA: peptide chain release factor N(5)-glutamine methyltransferase [Gemmatimonadales bacterium]|nr:peptide chain release factor N(5)-glutamine methyltransferase [Gemmatimonadales bacterium]